MILWTFKLLGSVRKAIAGRRYPGQLAWAVAFGILLGAVPHGNLLAIAIGITILCLKINHAMAGLVTVLVTLFATRFDGLFHSVGDAVLTNPALATTFDAAWQWPLVAWTDLNNTIVMGSFLTGVALLLPVAAVTYPIFRFWSRGVADVETGTTVKSQAVKQPIAEKPATVVIETPHAAVPAPKWKSKTQPPTFRPVATTGRIYDVRRIDVAEPTTAPAPASRSRTATEPTRSRAVVTTSASKETSVRQEADDQKKIDEALSHLLRQLRDSNDKDAA